MRALGILLLAIGVVLVAVAVVYWVVPAGHIPGFMGHVAGSVRHHTKRATAAGILGVICLIGGGVAITRRAPAARD